MNILILAAGQNPVPEEEGYPLCLVEFDSVPLIQRVTTACGSLNPKKLIVAFREEDVRGYHLDNVVTLLWPNANVLNVRGKTKGAACTALLAADMIDADEELLIVNGNEMLDADFSEIVEGFRRRNLDAGVVVFHSIHPRYSYVRLDENELVVEAAEKRPISTNATVGFYWFARGSEFVRAAKEMIRKDACVNDNFYICPTFNELVLEHKQIGIHKVDGTLYHPLKTSRQVELFEAVSDRNPRA
jgi:NDP-sugar pyrophosphorylase family protein